MPAPPDVLSAAPSRAAGPAARVEYLGFQDVGENRVFRLRVCGPEGPTAFRLCIARSAFDTGRIRRQDGPDICYQTLQRAMAVGAAASDELITIDDDDLDRYRVEHTPVPRRRSAQPPPRPTRVATAPRPERNPPRPSATFPPAPAANPEPEFEPGQRVNHAVFGVGVTAASSGAHTVVCFDKGGPRTFLTSMLEVEILSPPNTWETSARGTNRPCQTPSPR
jgi:hypothetical protein